MVKITKRQKEILKYIYTFLQEEGYPPSFEDFKNKFNFKSNQAVIDHLANLEKRGLIEREKRSARSITIKKKGFKLIGAQRIVPNLGVSSAGSFVDSKQLDGSWQKLSEDLEKFDEKVFIIKVKGDSMINAGINEGDLLLVQEQEEYNSKSIVVAQSPQGTTVKRFISEDNPPYLYLKPENPKYENIPFTDQVRLQGKVIGKFTNRGVEKITQKTT